MTNTGTMPITNVVVTDDNAMPTYSGDDFTVGTVTVLDPGASRTFTATRVPPVKMCNLDADGHTRKCGIMIVQRLLNHVKFLYLQGEGSPR